MLVVVQLIQAHCIAFCIVSNMVHKFWVGILIIGDVNVSSALDARGDGGEFLVGSGRMATWTEVMHTLSRFDRSCTLS